VLAMVLLLLGLQAPERVQLLFASDFYHDQITAHTGETWYGLFPHSRGWELAPTRIHVAPVNSGCMENGWRVTVDRPPHPLFLVRGATLLRAGQLTTVATTGIGLTPPTSQDFRFGQSAFRFVALGGDTSYTLRLVRLLDGRSQDLVSYHGRWQIAWPPKILWIGDLDRDGKPDFFADVHMFEIPPADWVLYLSSAAGPNELVHRVAEFQSVVC